MKAGKFYGPRSEDGRIKCPLDSLSLDEWEVRQSAGAPFFYEAGDGVLIIPNDGMTTDLGSTPRPVWTFVPKSEYTGPYVIHDCAYFYQYGFRPRNGLGAAELTCIGAASFVRNEVERCSIMGGLFVRVPLSRAASDGYLQEALGLWPGSSSLLKKRIIYRFVRMFGWWPWNKKRAKRKRWLDEH